MKEAVLLVDWRDFASRRVLLPYVDSPRVALKSHLSIFHPHKTHSFFNVFREEATSVRHREYKFIIIIIKERAMRSKEVAGKYTDKSEVKGPGEVITRWKARSTDGRLAAWDPQAIRKQTEKQALLQLWL